MYDKEQIVHDSNNENKGKKHTIHYVPASGSVWHNVDGKTDGPVKGKYYIVKKRGADASAQEAFVKHIDEVRIADAKKVLKAQGVDLESKTEDDAEALIEEKKSSFCETLFTELNGGLSMGEVFKGVAAPGRRTKRSLGKFGAQFADDGQPRLFDVGKSKMNIVYRE